jgi:predicted nucleic acid-binding protein
MRLVVADTSPLRYLVKIDLIDILAPLFEKIVIPSVVAEELLHPSAPAVVRDWMQHPPAWLEVLASENSGDSTFEMLDKGERAALCLAISLGAGLILVDDRKGASAGLSKGLEVVGTLGILDLAAERGLVDFADALGCLRATNFRYRPGLVDALLKKWTPDAGPR